MRQRIWIAFVVMMSLVSQAHAQDNSTPPGPSLARAHLLLTQARRDVFQSSMGLNDQQKDTFWNIFTDYDQQRASITDQTAQLLRRYAITYDTMTDEQAAKMMDEAAGIAEKQVRLRRKYADQIRKKLGGRVAARFYQIDDLLSTAVRLEVLDQIPFVGDPSEG